ncbi:MAG: hypothetical protein ACYCR7_04380 [Thermoplasmataceae archaeon]
MYSLSLLTRRFSNTNISPELLERISDLASLFFYPNQRPHSNLDKL